MTVRVGASVATTAGGDLNVPYPAGIVAGDQLVIFVGGSITTTFDPSAASGDGFTQHSVQDSAGSSPTGAVFARVATGTESGTALVSAAGGGGAYWGAMVAVANIDRVTPFDCADGTFSSSTSVSNFIITSQTTTVAGCTLFNFVFGNTTTGAWTPATANGGYTELFDEANSTNRFHLGVVDGWTGSGSTGTRTVVKTGTSTRGGGIGIALRPASLGPDYHISPAGSSTWSVPATALKKYNGSSWTTF